MDRTADRARMVVAACFVLAVTAPQPAPATEPRPAKPPREVCALLDDADVRPLMDGVLNHLLPACGRESELGRVVQPLGEPLPAKEAPMTGTDILVNDPSGDVGISQTQSETSIAVNLDTGTLCVGYNDSFHRVQGDGVTGFSRSIDGGATFDDRGALDPSSDGDPSLVWRQADGAFYFTTLADGGVALWRSTDDCLTFEPVGMVHEGPSDDKEMMTVDNSPSSAFFGRLYVAWTDFGTGGEIRLAASSDGGEIWSDPVRVSTLNTSVQGAWPTVAGNGDLYVAWTRFASGLFSIEAARSSDGGRSFTPLAPPAVDRVKPEDAEATAACARTALAANIRHSPFPQVAVGPDRVLHVVYAADPDGADAGDAADVFYRRSTDHGASWQPELRLNDDATLSDQFFPTLGVGESNVVSVSWYDRRHDPANLLIDHYQVLSLDGGVSWEQNERTSDVSTPVALDPAMATCYHGDYDSHLQTDGSALIEWSDDRSLDGGRNHADVFMDPSPLSQDFLVVPGPWVRSVCAPEPGTFDLEVRQFLGFDEPVTLSVPGLAPGLIADFSENPVVPPGEGLLEISGTGAVAAGSYGLTIEGVSDPGAILQSARVLLEIFSVVPEPPEPLQPADGATDIDIRPMLAWAGVEQAPIYSVEVADDPDFEHIVYAALETETEHLVSHPLAPETTHHWRVRAENPCGEGSWSENAGFTTRRVPATLLVDDDDNQPDVRTFYETALEAIDRPFDVWDTGNSNDEPTADDLAPYRVVIWFAGGEYGGGAGPGTEGENALASWLDRGDACFMLSGQDIHWDHGLTPLLEDYLGVAEVDDDTGQQVVTGDGPVFDGLGPYALAYPFNNYSDTVTPSETAEAAFVGDQGIAGISHSAGSFRTVFLGFPFEALPGATDRRAVMAAFDLYCAVRFTDGFDGGDTSAWSATVP